VQVPESQLVAGGLEPARGFPLPVLAAPLEAGAGTDGGKREFEVPLELAGTESLSFLPFARSMRVQIAGNWPHPGFTSAFLPVERNVGGGGFEALWQVLDLNRSYGAGWFQDDASLEQLQQSAFGVDLVQPVDLPSSTASWGSPSACLLATLMLLTRRLDWYRPGD
jgi:inner membrane protein involved in colicin E2 resistance